MVADDAARFAAPDEVLDVWRTFDAFPMETLTKAWVAKNDRSHQRSVAEMESHRARFGASGNCFDLAIWLRERFDDAGIESWFISDDIASRDAHVAVAAKGRNGRAYLCDLGDLWLQPIALDVEARTPVRGFFPGADVTTRRDGETLLVQYHRHGGKGSSQRYDLSPVSEAAFDAAASANQAYLAQVLVEMRDAPSFAHWEFDNGVARWSRHTGLSEEPMDETGAAAALIAARTGMNADYVAACLEAFAELTRTRR